MRDDLKIVRIKALIVRLNEGHDVPRKDLLRVLTDQEYKELDSNWKNEMQASIKKPNDIQRYEKLLKTANLHYNRYESMHAKKYDQIKTRAMIHLAEKKYYNAIECAEEIVSGDECKRIWFDRDVFKSEVCPSGMPQIITSRSNDNNQKGYSTLILGKKNKREYKLIALTNALEKLEPQDQIDPTDLCNAVKFKNINKQNLDFSSFKFEE